MKTRAQRQRRAAKLVRAPAMVTKFTAELTRETNRRAAHAAAGLWINHDGHPVADRTWPGVQSAEQVQSELGPLLGKLYAAAAARNLAQVAFDREWTSTAARDLAAACVNFADAAERLKAAVDRLKASSDAPAAAAA